MPEPPFKDPSELIDIFTTMEEQNLEKIQMMQDSEQQLEIAKATFIKTSEKLDQKIDQLKENEKKNEDNIRIITSEKDALTSAFEEVGKSSLIDPHDLAEIEQTTRELYVECVRIGSNFRRDPKGSLQDDPDYKKAMQMDNLSVLAECEYVIEKTIARLKMANKKDPACFEEAKRFRKKEQKQQ